MFQKRHELATTKCEYIYILASTESSVLEELSAWLELIHIVRETFTIKKL